MTIVARILVSLILTTLVAGGAHAQSAEFLFQLGTGVRGSGPGEFNTAADVAVDSTGRIFVSDNVNDRVQVFDSSGAFQFQFGTPGSGPGQFNQTIAIAVDALDRVFVGDQLNGRVQVFDRDGNLDPILPVLGGPGTGNGQFTIPGGLGIAFDSTNRIFVSDELANRIQVFNAAGVFQFAFGSAGTGPGQFNRPRGVAVDSADRIIVADIFNRRVQVFDSAGTYLFEFGSFGSGPGQFESARWVAVDRDDNILVADHGPTLGHDRIQVFDPSGNFLAQFGTPGSGPLQFNGATGLTVDGVGRVLAGDSDNFRVQVLVFDTDGDGIQDPVDNDIANFSSDFSDVALGGTSSGSITATGGGIVTVESVTDPFKFLRVSVQGNPSPAIVNACGPFDIRFLVAGGSTNIFCGSLNVEVLQGPVEILFGEAVLTAPMGADLTVTELADGQFAIENNSPAGTPPVVLAIGGKTVELAPSESFFILAIDIKPGSDPNSINPAGSGLIPVAILGSMAFDVGEIDPTTLAFGPAGAAPAHEAGHLVEDTNMDGYPDLVSHYRTQESGIMPGDTEACVTGELLDSTPFEGCDAIRTAGGGGRNCGLGAELTLLLAGLAWLHRRRLHRR